MSKEEVTSEPDDDRIILDKEQAADFGQILFDAIHAAVDLNKYANLPDDERRQGDMAEAYIRVWQELKVENAALKNKLAESRPKVDWPNQPGNWWYQYGGGHGLTHVPIACGKSGYCVRFGGAWRTREEFNHIYGPVLFIEAEPNPFAGATDER
jgi:hypothetical protein